MTSTVTVAAHPAEGQELVVIVQNTIDGKTLEEIVLQAGESVERVVYNHLAVKTFERPVSVKVQLDSEELDPKMAEAVVSVQEATQSFVSPETGLKLSVYHPDYPIQTPDQLLEMAAALPQAIERCGASPELTDAVTLAGELYHLLKAFFYTPANGRNTTDITPIDKDDLDAMRILSTQFKGILSRNSVTVGSLRRTGSLPVALWRELVRFIESTEAALLAQIKSERLESKNKPVFKDVEHLVQCGEALLELDSKGALVPHGLGGHTRNILEALIKQVKEVPEADKEEPEPHLQ